MRFAEILVALLVVGAARSAPAPAIITPQDIKDYAEVIPVDKVWVIVTDYLAYDQGVKNLLGQIHTDEFKHMITAIDTIPEFIEFLNSLEAAGYEAYKYWNIIHTLLGMAGIVNPSKDAPPPPEMTGGIAGMFTDIKAVLDTDAIKAVYDNKVKANPHFKSLVDLFGGDKFQTALGKMAALPEVTTMIEKMGLSEVVDKDKEKKHD